MSSNLFEANDYQIPSNSIDDHPLSFNHINPSKYDHRLPKNKNQPPSQQPPARSLHSKDQHHLTSSLNHPSSQQPPARTLPSDFKQPERDNHAKLTSAEPPVDFPKSHLSQPDRPPLPQQQRQPPTRTLPSEDEQLLKNPQSQRWQPVAQIIPSTDQHLLKNLNKPPSPPPRTLPSSVEQPIKYKQPINHAKLTTDDQPPRIYSESYLSQSDEAPPSQPDSPAQPLPPKDRHLLKNSPHPPSPSPQPPVQTLPSNVEQPEIYKQPGNHGKLTSHGPDTFYPKDFLSQPDGPPSPLTYPPLQAPPPNDPHLLKNVGQMPGRTRPPYVELPTIYKQPTDNEKLTSEPSVTVYPEIYTSKLGGPPPPPQPPIRERRTRVSTDKNCCAYCSIL